MWLQGSPYTDSRRVELRRAWDEYRGLFPGDKNCEHIDSFGKLEFYPELKELRWINSRADCFKAWSGRLFKAIEDEIYQNPWFIKHIPVPDRPRVIAALRAAGLHYYENDYKAFESHFVVEVMNVLELKLYRWCLADDPEDAEKLCAVIGGHNSLHTRAGVKWRIRARRMSGDMCTSLGNGFSNLMLILFIVSQKGGSVNGFVEGDDGLFATDVTLSAKDFEELGFTVEIHEVSDPTDAHFCGCCCTAAGEIIKDPRRVFTGFGWTHSAIHAGNKVMDELLRSKALSLCYEAPNAPIVGVLARVALSLTEGMDARKEDGTWKSAPADFDGPTGAFEPSVEARQKLERLFGISVSVQLLAEEAIRAHDFPRLSNLIPPLDDVAWYEARYVEPR